MSGGPVLIGIPGCELDDRGRDWLEHPSVGGVVLFRRNFSNQAQLIELGVDLRPSVRRRLEDEGTPPPAE